MMPRNFDLGGGSCSRRTEPYVHSETRRAKHKRRTAPHKSGEDDQTKAEVVAA